MAKRVGFRFKDIHGFLQSLFGEDLHAKRMYSLANATVGVITGFARHSCDWVGAGAGTWQAHQTCSKTSRPIGFQCGVEVWSLLAHWVPYVVGPRQSIVVAMDWTDFDPDGQATIMVSLLTRHGRATPLIWLTVDKGTLKEQRNAYEDRVLIRLSEVLPEGVQVLLVADRGFGDQKLYHLLEHELNFDYVMRFRGNIYVTDAHGETRPAAEWVGPGGRARTLRGAAVTADHYRVGTVVCVRGKEMKEP